MNNELWLIWKEPITRRRFKVGSLKKINNSYIFNYVNPELDEAVNAGFTYFPGFSDTRKEYKSDILFANILSRLPNSVRPDYLEILNSYNLDMDSNELEILEATRGRTLTDNYEFVPAFDKSKIEFDVAGTSHCADIIKCKNLLSINKKLYLEPESNNPYDKNAIKVMFKENGDSYHLGYVPRYYCNELLDELNKGVTYSAMIKALNLNSQLYDENITTSVKLIFNI